MPIDYSEVITNRKQKGKFYKRTCDDCGEAGFIVCNKGDTLKNAKVRCAPCARKQSGFNTVLPKSRWFQEPPQSFRKRYD